MSTSFPLKAIFGLGNPGLCYAKTRHNAGFLFLDRWVTCHGHSPQFSRRKWRGRIQTLHIDSGELVLIKPQTFMNLSGECYEAVLHANQWLPMETLIVVDDIALPVGRIRLRDRGSSGGQKGLTNILHRAGTQEIPRMRIGIGSPPEDISVSDYVLSECTPPEWDLLDGALNRACDALDCLLREGMGVAMARYNG